MKKMMVLILCLGFLFRLDAQPPGGMMPKLSKEEIAEMKKEVADLEAEIRRAEKEDPQEAAMLKTQLSALKAMLGMVDKPVPEKPVKTPPAPRTVAAPSVSPITPVVLRQPVVPPTEAQARDYFFCYKGKKVNDSTLVTPGGTVVQYSKKKLSLIIRPDEKKDSFNLIAARLTRTEEQKQALVAKFDKTKNGFIFYPYLELSLVMYDDLNRRYAAAVKNTVPLKPVSRPVAKGPAPEPEWWRAQSGPQASATVETAGDDADLFRWAMQQLELARKKVQQLPPVQDFPAPPTRDLGYCMTCDSTAISRQFIRDSLWTDTYFAKERDVTSLAMDVLHTCEVLGVEDSASYVHNESHRLLMAMLARMTEKNRVLLNRYGDNLQYQLAIGPVVLGVERQLQLLGSGATADNGDLVNEFIDRGLRAYEKYYAEQEQAKNHDFVLNLPFHLGIERQRQLLGASENSLADFMKRFFNYNRFAISLDVDFVWEQKTDEGELDLRATGTLASRGKDYAMLVPDKCGYRMKSYSADLDNMNYADVTIVMDVKGGVKTVRVEDGKLRTIPYSGPATWNLNFPDTRLDFCANAIPDTLFLSTFSGDEANAAQAAAGIQAIRDKYTADLPAFATLVWTLEEGGTVSEEEAMNKAAAMMQTMAGFGGASAAGLQGKLKQKYEGYMQMDNARKGLQSAMNTRKAQILFNAANRSTVVTDKYQDSKRKLEDGAELVRGMAHFRLMHDPLK